MTSQCIRLGKSGDGVGGMPLSFCCTTCFCSKQQQKATTKTSNVFSLSLEHILLQIKQQQKHHVFSLSLSLSLLKIFDNCNDHTNLNNYVLSLRIAQERSDCPSEHLLPFLSISFVSVFCYHWCGWPTICVELLYWQKYFKVWARCFIHVNSLFLWPWNCLQICKLLVYPQWLLCVVVLLHYATDLWCDKNKYLQTLFFLSSSSFFLLFFKVPWAHWVIK